MIMKMIHIIDFHRHCNVSTWIMCLLGVFVSTWCICVYTVLGVTCVSVSCSPEIPHIPHRDDLLEIFPQ